MTPEAVLGGRRREGRRQETKVETLEDLDLRTQERDWTIGSALISRLAWLENRNHMGRLSNCRKIGRLHREIEEVCEETDPQRTKMF